MNILKALESFAKGLGSVVVKALGYANLHGLTDAIVSEALKYVEEAAATVMDNEQKREYVITRLVAKGVPEFVARLAVELAVAAYKSRVPKV